MRVGRGSCSSAFVLKRPFKPKPNETKNLSLALVPGTSKSLLVLNSSWRTSKCRGRHHQVPQAGGPVTRTEPQAFIILQFGGEKSHIKASAGLSPLTPPSFWWPQALLDLSVAVFSVCILCVCPPCVSVSKFPLSMTAPVTASFKPYDPCNRPRRGSLAPPTITEEAAVYEPGSTGGRGEGRGCHQTPNLPVP